MNASRRPERSVPPKAGSGEHPAAQAYREKVESIVDGVEADADALNRELANYLESVKTPVPPALPKWNDE